MKAARILGSLSAKIGLVLLVLYVLNAEQRLISGIQLQLEWPPYEQHEITRVEQRFTRLRALLPPHGRVGFVSDTVRSGLGGQYVLTLARYALAPLTVEEGAACCVWVVGYFAAGAVAVDASFDDAATRASLQVVHDFGDGVVLLRNPQIAPGG
ncbi:MAG: hypothetical protein JXB47_18295 [Anaerolineae bacterium]|nr:hypothetical protein [Anaerolineae bacterium]